MFGNPQIIRQMIKNENLIDFKENDFFKEVRLIFNMNARQFGLRHHVQPRF